MFDKKGRVWLAAAVRGPENPAFCKKGSDHPSAKLFPMEQTRSARYRVLDPKTMKYTFVDTCFQTHHLQFGYDANDTLWTSSGGGGGVVGWLEHQDVRRDRRRGESRRAGRALVLDTNGNGKRDAYVEPECSRSIPTKDKRIAPVFYAVMPSPVDGSIWGIASGEPRRGRAARARARTRPRPRSPKSTTCRCPASAPRGGDIDSKGVVWVSLASGHIGSFDRRKCKGPLNGPKATGDHCPEGWTFYQYPGPGLRGHRRRTAPSRATTAGSISTTRSGSARTCRCRRAT